VMIAVTGMRVVEMPCYYVVFMITMRYGLMSASRSVLVPIVVTTAGMIGRAPCLVGR